MVTSARLLCKMPLLSILLLAVIANGIGSSHRLTQEAVIMHKEICHILDVARWSVVWYELLNPAWSSACSWSSRGYNLLYSIVENSLYNAGNEQIGW